MLTNHYIYKSKIKTLVSQFFVQVFKDMKIPQIRDPYATPLDQLPSIYKAKIGLIKLNLRLTSRDLNKAKIGFELVIFCFVKEQLIRYKKP